MAELKYEITAQIGVLSERSGWTKELNIDVYKRQVSGGCGGLRERGGQPVP